jgi:phosphate transport system permease protein
LNFYRMNRNYHRWRKLKNRTMQIVTFCCAVLVLLPLALVFYHVLKSGISSVNWAFFTQLPKPVGESGGGIANAIVGTFELIGLGAILGVPIGLFGGIFLSEYGWARANSWVRFGADVLNGVPSIIWGMVVWGLMVKPMKTFSALAGAVVLGLMMIPMIMRTTEEVLLLVPGGYREAALALGIPQWRTVLQIVVRTALKGIITGMLFTALGNRFWNHSLTDPVSALPLQIFTYAVGPYEDWHRQAWAGALVLLLMVALVNVSVRLLTRDRMGQQP